MTQVQYNLEVCGEERRNGVRIEEVGLVCERKEKAD